jgi:hypothetical protein
MSIFIDLVTCDDLVSPNRHHTRRLELQLAATSFFPGSRLPKRARALHGLYQSVYTFFLSIPGETEYLFFKRKRAQIIELAGHERYSSLPYLDSGRITYRATATPHDLQAHCPHLCFLNRESGLINGTERCLPTQGI